MPNVALRAVLFSSHEEPILDAGTRRLDVSGLQITHRATTIDDFRNRIKSKSTLPTVRGRGVATAVVYCLLLTGCLAVTTPLCGKWKWWATGRSCRWLRVMVIARSRFIFSFEDSSFDSFSASASVDTVIASPTMAPRRRLRLTRHLSWRLSLLVEVRVMISLKLARRFMASCLRRFLASSRRFCESFWLSPCVGHHRQHLQVTAIRLEFTSAAHDGWSTHPKTSYALS